MQLIPKTRADVTRDWLAEVLLDCNIIGAASQLKSLRHEPMGEGVGMMSAISRLHLEWEGDADGLPEHLVIKIPAGNKANRAVAEQFNLYRKEVGYYRDLAPVTSARSPQVYASMIDEDQNFFLLMEDASDYRMGNQVTGATLDETNICIDELAKLHASFSGKIDQVDWLPHIANSENARTMALGAEAGWPQLMEYFGEFVPDAISNRKEEYLAAIPSLQEALDREPVTLIHGDFRMDNMLFGQASGQSPLLIVDFQGPLKGRGIQDFAYLLSHSTQTEVRRVHEKAILQRYLDGLTAAGISGYDLDTAWADYRLGVLYCWTVAVVIAGTLDPGNDRGFAWMAKMVERNGIAIEDLACLNLL